MVNRISDKFLACLVIVAALALALFGQCQPSAYSSDDCDSAFDPEDSSAPGTHRGIIIVEPGQRLSAIARVHEISLKQLLEMNKGLAADNYKPGDVLVVPEPMDRMPELPDLSMEVRRGIRGRKQIALTFDCGWVTRKDLQHLLKVLKDQDVRASFFLTAIFLKGNPTGFSLIRNAGFPVYNHSMNHPHFKTLTDDGVRKQLLQLEEKVKQEAPVTTRPFWRPPYGERDSRVLKAAAFAGYRSIYWTLDSRDSMSSPTLTANDIYKRICREYPSKNPKDPNPLDGAILLFHAGNHITPDALDEIIPYLRKKGYTFADLQTLLTP